MTPYIPQTNPRHHEGGTHNTNRHETRDNKYFITKQG